MADADSLGGAAAQQQALAALADQNARAVRALIALERRAIADSSGALRQRLTSVFRTLAGRYVLMFGSLQAPADPVRAAQLTQILVDELEHIRGFDPTPALMSAADVSTRAGVVYANRHLSAPVPMADISVEPEVEQLVRAAAPAVDRALESAQQYAEQTPIAAWDDVVRQMGKASQAATSLDRSAAVVVSAAQASGVRQVAVARDAQILWVAEPDACVVCLGLSGTLADPAAGVWFNEHATFGRPSNVPSVWPPGQPLKGPPRHPHCRCVPELWFGPALPEGHPGETSLYGQPTIGAQVDIPAALRREARRSIVHGWSLPSESSTVRLDAAARLLAHGAGLPKSVEARGRAAVKAGKFENRTHPTRR